MATNPFFNWYPETVTNEQLLIEDLAIEALQINGMDLYYIPRASAGQLDKLYGEDQLKSFSAAYKIEMYLENVSGMDGEGDFMAKFGLEIRDELSLLVSRRRFRFTIPNQIRPNEGDLIFIPLLANFFEITFVEHENNQAAFYTLGRGRASNVVFYALKLRQFVFNEERIVTGVTEIDAQIVEAYRPVGLWLERFLVEAAGPDLRAIDHACTIPYGKLESFSAPVPVIRKLSSTRKPPPPSQ